MAPRSPQGAECWHAKALGKPRRWQQGSMHSKEVPWSWLLGTSQLLAVENSLPFHGSDQRMGRGLLTSSVATQPVTPKYFPPSGDKGKESGLALVKCGADSFTASLGRGAERKSVRYNLC